VSGPGVPSGSDIIITAFSTGAMCGGQPNNFIAYRPVNDTQFMPPWTYSGSNPVPFACGLNVDSLPGSVGASLTGSFAGTLKAINDPSGRTKTLSLTFSAQRTQ
jgi:hypothetical protein